MSQGRTSVIRALGVAWMLLTVSAVDAQTPDANKPTPLTPVCRPAGNIIETEALVKGGYVGEDGKVHFTFGIEPGADPIQVKAFIAAVGQWNELSHVTWMMLEPGTPAGSDISFGTGPFEFEDKDGKKTPKIYCGKHDPNDSSVRYHPSNMKFAPSFPFLAVKIYTHEIGHVLGLDHSKDGSLMAAPPERTPDCQTAAEISRDLDSDVALAALHCAFAIHYRHKQMPK
jgi:hypothetical protein